MTPIEIRERVAREVFGLTDIMRAGWCEVMQSESRGLEWVLDFKADGDELGCDESREPVPHYETDITAAFQVVEEMRKRGWRLRLIQTDNGAWFAEFAPVRLGQPYKTGVSDPVAATAISLAALAALEAK